MDQNKENQASGACSMHERRVMHTNYKSEYLQGRNKLANSGFME
jgi:hypothetical protein